MVSGAYWYWALEVDANGGADVRRYTPEDINFSDGKHGDGRLQDLSAVIDKDLGAAEQSRAVFADFDVIFDDPDATIYAEATGNLWSNATCRVYLGEGDDWTTYVEVFRGVVVFPGMVSRTSTQTSVKIRDKRNKDARTLPLGSYSSTAFDPVDAVSADQTSQTFIDVYDSSRFYVGMLLEVAGDDNSGDGYRVTGIPSATRVDISETLTTTTGEAITPLHYADLEQKSEGRAIPILYGDWSTAAGQQMVPVTCIDTVNSKFKICDNAIVDLSLASGNGGKVIKVAPDGETDVTADIINVDYNRGTFQFDVTPYDDATDDVYVNVQGSTDDGTKDGTLITAVTGQWEDILKQWMAQADADIDQTALTAWKADVADLGRIHISTSESTDDLLSAIYLDTFSDGDFRAGKYYPIFRRVSTDSSATEYDATDIIDDGINDGPERPRYSFSTDPQLYLNRANYRYSFDPREGFFALSGRSDRFGEQAARGAVRSRELDFRFLYVKDEVSLRASREMVVFANDIETLQVTFTDRALTLNLGDNFLLTFDVFTKQQFVIRRISYDIAAVTAEIEAWNVSDLGVSRWTADSDPTYLLSTPAQRGRTAFTRTLRAWRILWTQRAAFRSGSK